MNQPTTITLKVVGSNNEHYAAFRFDYHCKRDVEETLKRIFPLILTQAKMMVCEQLEMDLDVSGIKIQKTNEQKRSKTVCEGQLPGS